MSGQRRCKTLIIADDEEEEVVQEEELNPFSFKEFLRWKNQDQDPDQDQDQDQYQNQDQTFRKEEEEEEEWGRSFQSGLDTSSSLCSVEEEETRQFGRKSLPIWQHRLQLPAAFFHVTVRANQKLKLVGSYPGLCRFCRGSVRCSESDPDRTAGVGSAMSGQRRCKTLIIADDEEEEVVQEEELNPFSFKEFLRWKNQDQDPDQDQDQDQYQNQDQTFRKEEEEEEEWGRSFQSGLDTSSSLCSVEEEETRFSSTAEGAGGGAENHEGDDDTSLTEEDSCRRSGRKSQIQQLKEENELLRRTIRELQKNAESAQRRASLLSEELLQKKHQEEKEAQDLENMVQSVEQNLQLMTRRAVKAESSVSRLKMELQQLQVEAESLRSQNNSLKAAESLVVMTMRQNAQVASEYLDRSVNHTHSSIRQLLEEAQTLRLVSQLLQSIDKISTVDKEP